MEASIFLHARVMLGRGSNLIIPDEVTADWFCDWENFGMRSAPVRMTLLLLVQVPFE